MLRSSTTYLITVALLGSFVTAPAAAQQRRTSGPPRPFTDLASDRTDYILGATALFNGWGFNPGELVTLRVLRVDGTPIGLDNDPWGVVANATGSFLTSWAPLESTSVGVPLFVTAQAASGLGAHTTINFNHDCGTGVVQSVTPVGGSCADFTPAQGNGPDNYEVEEGGTYVMTIAGVTECSGDTITVFIQSSNTGNFCFDATGGSGTYVGTFTMPDPACHTFPISYKCGAGAPCSHTGSFSAQGLTSGCNGAHLRASLFDGNCNRTGTDETCEAVCVETTLDFEGDGCLSPWPHGLDLETDGPECVMMCPSITSGPDDGDGNAGAAIFDTETVGGSQDPDLQAVPDEQGNVLIVQNNGTATVLLKTGVNGADTYDHPNDDQDGGVLTFDFCTPVEAFSIVLIDIDNPAPNQNASVVLTDLNWFTRTYTVPGGWTNNGGLGTLNLEGLDQLGPGIDQVIATVVTQGGYDETQVVQIRVRFGSSGALDDLKWCE